MPLSLSRRTLLRAALAGGAATVLVACDSERRPRLPAPSEPVVQPDDPATWPADSELLLEVREQVHQVLASAREVESPGRALSELQSHWTTQLTRLEELVSAGGVPLPELPELPPQAVRDDAATTAPGDGSTGTEEPEDEAAGDDAAATWQAPGSLTPTQLGEELRERLPDLVEQISSASPLNLPVLVSLAAHHASSAIRLRAPIEWEPLAGPEGAAAVPLLAVARPAVFGLEVLAARSFGKERESYEKVLDGVRSLTRQLTSLAGDAAPVAPLGYDLPESLDEEDARHDLARALVGDLAPAALRTAERVSGRPDQMMSIVRVVAESVPWARSFGGPGEPFPGMTLP